MTNPLHLKAEGRGTKVFSRRVITRDSGLLFAFRGAFCHLR